MKHIYLTVLISLIAVTTSFAQDTDKQPGIIGVHMIPKDADQDEARRIMVEIGKSMKAADGCINVYTSKGNINTPRAPTDYSIVQTMQWRSTADFFNWMQGEESQKKQFGSSLKKINAEMFWYEFDPGSE